MAALWQITTAAGNPTSSLPTDRLHFGLANGPGDLSWMTSSGVPWRYRYQYLSSGVNTGTGWETWNSPAGAFATYYMSASAGAGYIPVFTYYELLQSNPSIGSTEMDRDYSNLNNASTMNAYYANFALLMQKAKAFGQLVIVHVEPDLFGYMEQKAAGGDASTVSASVASTGYPGLGAFPNTFQGFNWALLMLRDTLAPNVVLAVHASTWASGVDIGLNTDPNFNMAGDADKVAAFLQSAGVGLNSFASTYDLVFNDVADHDAGYSGHWWDRYDQTLPDFAQWLTWMAELHVKTARPLIVWQVPVGNQYFRTMNQTTGHYQDNRAEYFLSHVAALQATGIIAVLFGKANGNQTTYTDYQADGVTNPAPVSTFQCAFCNTNASVWPDDDGGYLRTFVGLYYSTNPATAISAVAGDREATLTWNPPTVGPAITSYAVVASPGGAVTTVSAAVPAATITGLTNGVPYTFTVIATNAYGIGVPSAATLPVTPSAVAQAGPVEVLPAITNGAYGGYLTATYLLNTGAGPAHIRVQYFDTSGHGVGLGNSAAGLAPGSTWTLRTDNGDSLGSGVAGSAIVYSDQPLAVFVNEFAPGGTDATSYTAVTDPGGAGTTLFAPAIANKAYGGYTTGIGLVNLAAVTVTITVTYRDATGAVIKTQVFSMAAGAYAGLYSGDATLNLPTPFAGTATISSSGGNLAAVVNETGPGNQLSSYDAVPAGSTTLFAPAMLRNPYGGYNTGTGIQNTTGTAGTVTITYYNGAGTPTVTTHPIAANGYLGIYQGTDIPADGAYTAKITSDVAIAAIVNEVAHTTNLAVQQSTSYNTFATGSSTLHLPLVESGGADGWSTGEGIMNTGATATTVTVTYYDAATGAVVGTPQAQLLQPNAYWGVYQPTGGLPGGSRASVLIAAPGGQLAVICNESSATSFMSYTAQ